MRDVLPDIDRWRAKGVSIAVATVIQTWGSAPRGVGARMAMTREGEIAGSVSGGCVEGAVYESGMEVLKTGRPQLLHFGVADDTAWEVGLACGGIIEIFVEPLDSVWYETVRAALLSDKPAATAVVLQGSDDLVGKSLTVLEGGELSGTMSLEMVAATASAAQDGLARGEPARLTLAGPDSEARSLDVFVDVQLPAPKLVIVGGVHIAIALAGLAKTLGYRTVLIDPRAAFGSEARFPHVDQLVQEWPDEALTQVHLTRSTAVAALTHDPKLDDPALLVALTSPAFYVGALGSLKTQTKRRQRLLEAGLTETQLARLHGPIGLDLGARTPEEIALAIMGEIVECRNTRNR